MIISKTLLNAFLTFCFSISYFFGFSQNLIPNPSLEEENVCKTYQENCAPKAWRSNSLKAFLYYDYQISRQDETTIKPAGGNRCISLRVFNTHRKLDRSFAQTPLLCQLEKGKKYKLQFQMLSQTYYVNSFEILFLDTVTITKKNDGLFEKKPQIVFEFTKPFPPKKWITLDTIYEATGNEVGLMIGNFKRDESTVITLLQKKDKKGKKVRRVYHYFDNFSLTPLDELEVDCDLEKTKQYIYADSARHIILSPPQSVQNIPPQKIISKPEIKPKEFSPPLSPLPQEVEKFIPEKTFTLPNILFATNSDQLLPISYNSLDELVVFLQDNQQYYLSIMGHTDDVGDAKSNLILSQKRANSVANYLISRGIHISKISTQGKGESQPITINNSPEKRQQNRRVEFEVFKK